MRSHARAWGIMLVAAAGIAVFPGVAPAQEVPRSVAPGQLEKRFEAPPEPKERVAPIIPAAEGELPPEEARRIRFTLSGVVVEGATAYEPSEFAPFYEELLAREVSLADLYEVAARITEKYTGDGYLLSRAVVPPQEVELGIVRIRVIEGYLENIIFEGKVAGAPELLEAYARKITSVQPLRQDVLERYILLMNDLPGLSARRRLQPAGTEEGAFDLIIRLSHDPAYGFARVDNRGSKFAGPFQLWLGGGSNSALGLWEKTQVRGVTVTTTDELVYGDVSHTQMVGTEGTTATLFASYSKSEPGDALSDDDIDTTGLFASLAVNHPLIRSRKQDLAIGGRFTYLDSVRDESDLQTIDDRLRVLRLYVRYGVIDGAGGTNRLSVQVSRGLDVLDATTESDALSSRSGAPAEFTKVNVDASRRQDLGGPWSLLAAVTGQRSGTKLFLAEQIGIGGEQFGRAYDPSEIAGDDGVAAKLELQRSTGVQSGIVREAQFFTYYDYGAVWERSSADDFDDLSSFGAGVRARLEGGIFASVEAAKPLTRKVDALGDDGDDWRVFFVLSANF